MRNESNIISTKKRQKTASMCIAHYCKSLQIPSFSVDTSINQKNIRFISYNLIFISFQQINQSF